MYEFDTIKIKKTTANKFRIFAKKLSKSQTDTLDLMISFFIENSISPEETKGSTIHTLENLIKKRINGLVAIIKDIEKHQTQPTVAMLQLLFENTAPKAKQPRLVEKKQKPFYQDSFATSLEAIELRKEKNTFKKELKDTLEEFSTVLHNTKIIKSNFGKTRLQLDMPLAEFEELKQRIKSFENVY